MRVPAKKAGKFKNMPKDIAAGGRVETEAAATEQVCLRDRLEASVQTGDSGVWVREGSRRGHTFNSDLSKQKTPDLPSFRKQHCPLMVQERRAVQHFVIRVCVVLLHRQQN